MGLFDSLFGFFGSQGSTVTSNVTASQPTTSSGGTYVSSSGSGSGTTYTSYQSQPASPTPIQVTPTNAIQGTYNYVTGIIGGGIQQGQQLIQGIQSPSATNPIQQVQTTIIGAISPQTQPIVQQPIQNVNQTSVIQPQQGTIFVQQGDIGQIAVQGKLFYDQSGQYEVLDVPYGHSITNIAASGSAGSLQAGGVSLAPLTPVVYTRESAGTVLDPQYANVPLATQVLANPSAFSDVGAEAYGGYVQPLDNRTLESSGAIIGQYPASSGNLGNLVSPYILNEPKSTWVQDLPWSIPISDYKQAATISFVDMQNRISPISPMGMQSIGMSDRLIGGGKVAGTISIIDKQTGMPMPFLSTYADQPSVTTPPKQMNFFDSFQSGISERMYSGVGSVFGVTGEQAKTALSMSENINREFANALPFTFMAPSVGVSEIKKGFDEPVIAAANVGIGIAFGAGWKAIEGVYGASRAVAAERIISTGQTARAADIFGNFVMTNTPRVLAGLYAFDVTGRSTSGFRDFRAGSVLSRGSTILTYETIPMGIGFMIPGKSIQLVRESNIGYRTALSSGATTGRFDYYIKQPASVTYERIPSIDQVRYKLLEIRSPTTAISQPMPSERFITPSRTGGDFTGSARSYFKARSYSEVFGTSRMGGSVSGRPTPRQESLRLNYNPTARLTEIDVSSITPKIISTGQIGGIRGSLRGKWDTGLTGSEDPFVNLPLKMRWKMRTESIPGTEVKRGYFGSGSPSGGLQSGVGIGGTTVRGGRQVLEMRMPSSGIPAEIESLAPQKLEIIPSRRTAQRSRAYDLEFEYESRRLPEGMTRPQPSGQTITEPKTGELPIWMIPSFSIQRSQQTSQSTLEKQLTKSEVTPISREDILSKSRQDMMTASIQNTVLRSGVLSLTLSGLIQQQTTRQIQTPISLTEPMQTPSIVQITSRITESQSPPYNPMVEIPTNVPPQPPLTTITQPVPPATQTVIQVPPQEPIQQIIQPVVPPVMPPIPGMLGGGGGGSSYGYRGSRSWTVKNPVGADLMASKRKMNFRPPKGMKIKKF